MKFITCIVVSLSILLSACATVKPEDKNVFYGKVVSVRPFLAQETQPNGVGALVGATAGGVIGHQFGKGDGKTAMTVLGVLGGAVAGSQYNKQVINVPMTELVVQMPDGSTFNVNVKDSGFQVGQQVMITQNGKKAEIKGL
ncbi:outer membrane lipoprotein [Aquitalea pelogenes]|uniref:glycine zipper 2TM domain-containing protein n=1 Tax=Aquitalea pelogenes TaxID=1293573 RepID=UPI0035B45B87